MLRITMFSTLFVFLAAIGCSFTAHAAASVIKLLPHRAVYHMTLAQSRQSSQVINAEGKMTYTLGDACNGWTNEQKLEMKYYYAQGQVVESTIRNASWEAKDGSRYTFTAESGSDGQINSAFRGEATSDTTSGKVTYTIPKDKKAATLSAGTIFPNQHAVMILEAAQQGRVVPNKTVFDGSDEVGQSEISIFIGKPFPSTKDTNFDPQLSSNPLLQDDAWPVRMAFYPMQGNDGGLPDYEMTMDMLPNGVARGMLVDYGDFSVRGVLSALEALPTHGC